MKVDYLRSCLAQHLPARLYGTREGRFARRLWAKLFRFYTKGRLPVQVRLHGRMLLLNAANPYPFVLKDAPQFNAGLVAATAVLRQHLGRPLRIVDVGAAFGDTVALLNHEIAGCMESCVCVDGSEENAALFAANIADIPGVSFHCAMLAAKSGPMATLNRHHPGSAMATGAMGAPSQTLDQLLAGCGSAGKCDLLKIDVDGFDGEVLLGATETLVRHQPLVIFEWHPRLIQLCGNDHRTPFRALAGAGYRHLLWFGNRGLFSHRGGIPEEAEINWWRDFLIAKDKPSGPHFDIVALPPSLECLADPIAGRAISGPGG